MTESPKMLREHAQAAVRMAETAGPEGRKCLLALAKTWFAAADRLERRGPFTLRTHGRAPERERKQKDEHEGEGGEA